MNNLDYLGSAEMWPTQINALGQISLTSEFDLIEQSIIRYLSTPFGTEFFNEDSGSRIGNIPYEPNDDVLQAMLETTISETININEGRVRYVDTTFSYDDNDESKVLCEISVMVLNRNEVHSFIWPYYKNEA